MHLASDGELGILSVLRDHATEGCNVFQSATHQHSIGNALSVV
jgi:hypothetical protein